MTKYFPLVLLSWQTTGGPAGRAWLKVPSRVPDVCSGKMLMYFKVFHFLGSGHLMGAEEEEIFCNLLCLGRCAGSLETAWLRRLFIHPKKVEPELVSYNASTPADTHARELSLWQVSSFLVSIAKCTHLFN